MLKNKKILFPELSYILNGLFFKTHNKLGRYKNEKQYSDYFESLLKNNNINYFREFALSKFFKEEKRRRNIVDFIIDDKIIIDFKTKTIITKDDYFQMQRYLSSSGKQLGIIVNFRRVSINPKRIMNVETFNINKKINSDYSDNNSD
jgi:GxxExxY protein